MQLTWYLPTFYGDIQLKSLGRSATLVTFNGLTPQEKLALRALCERAVQKTLTKARWAEPSAVEKLSLDSGDAQYVELAGSILDVQKVLEKPLKPGRKQVSVVKFSGGKVEEINESTIGLVVTDAAAETVSETTTPAKKEPKKETAVATTVAAPVRGCPAPDFAEAELRATAVLKAFLDPQQIEDFNRYNGFIAVGADTGHRYMLTSRNARSALAKYQRTLFDLDEQNPCCVHDWDVPAAEELLGIYAHLSVPGLEGYLRTLPEEIPGGLELERPLR